MEIHLDWHLASLMVRHLEMPKETRSENHLGYQKDYR
jgi:hypothetical protein